MYFRGVRYADAPVGDLRWRAPVSPPSGSLGSVNATDVRISVRGCLLCTELQTAKYLLVRQYMYLDDPDYSIPRHLGGLSLRKCTPTVSVQFDSAQTHS